MGLSLYGRTLNDNTPKRKGGLDEVPISAEDWRHPPVIEAEKSHRWYCLVTVPQGEYRCADGLSDAGIASYVPTSTQWVQKRKGRDLIKAQTQTPLLRGYCFARLSRAFVENEDTFARKLVLGSDWTPIFATGEGVAETGASFSDDQYEAAFRAARNRNVERRNAHGILGVVSSHGLPSPMPLRDGKNARQGLADIADDELAGWFDEGRRAGLMAGKNAKPRPVVMKGEEVRVTSGPFASFRGIAENDNDKLGVRVAVDIFGRSTPVFVPVSDLENLTRPDAKLKVGLRRA